MKNEIEKHLSKLNLDVRISRNSRFMDQKVTPDVLCIVSECILEFISANGDVAFTKNDIWHADYSNDLIKEVFNKPDLKSADREYDKFFSQPLKLLSYAGILIESKVKRSNSYKIVKHKLLEFISLRERNSLYFLSSYLEKVTRDSGLYAYLETFFTQQDKASLTNLKNQVDRFYRTYTDIKNEFEAPRIFNKIINILAFKKKLKGTVRGNLSSTIIPIQEIRYNRVNWRDKGKDKSIPRSVVIENTGGFYKYSVEKAKKFVKRIHQYSEPHRYENYPALHAHHIFLASEFPEIADLPENIICLTPNQHYLRAHPNSKTSAVDVSYQLICLISKLDSIEDSYVKNDDNYSLTDFVEVLNIGFKTTFFKKSMGFEELKHSIVRYKFEQLSEV